MKKLSVRKKVRNASRSSFNFLSALGWIILCEISGIVGSLFTAPSIPTWYATLNKPVFSPPNWVFAPVWTILYALMGIAAYRVWRLGVRKHLVRSAVILFLIHLFLNAIWSPIFFGAQNIPFAFVDIAALWVMIIVVIFKFYELDRMSAYLLLPYLSWVSFATVLNYYLWLLNF